MEQLAEQLKGLADPTRLRVLHLLEHGEQRCVCDLMAALALPQSTVSRHMSFLKRGSWVTSRRKGKWIYYTLATPTHPLQQQLLDALLEHLHTMPQAQQDNIRLLAHLQTKTTTTCKG